MGWPAAELSEKDGAYQIQIALRGFEAKDVELTATPSEIIVHAATKEEKRAEKGNVLWTEFGSNDVYRSFAVPNPVNVNKVTANLENGVLRIDAPQNREIQRGCGQGGLAPRSNALLEHLDSGQSGRSERQRRRSAFAHVRSGLVGRLRDFAQWLLLLGEKTTRHRPEVLGLQIEQNEATREATDALCLELTQRFESPRPFRSGSVPAQDVEVAVVGTYFKEQIVRAKPLVDDFFDNTRLFPDLKTNWAFIGLASGVALNPQGHFLDYPAGTRLSGFLRGMIVAKPRSPFVVARSPQIGTRGQRVTGYDLTRVEQAAPPGLVESIHMFGATECVAQELSRCPGGLGALVMPVL
jgi:hypothetical protein